ncbi:uncharacterized protein BJX67DRAFT_187679 [Aspergillus lucknowensis]|uniref:Major facilitator superfamily (MFS) profile domain-containing protein n=1 Tax=Aspergillus lucknowensis TaxID=176173 RepID=A0ABR4LKM3_9EURO
MKPLVSFAVLHAVPLSGIMLDQLGTRRVASLLTGILFLRGVYYGRAQRKVLGHWLPLRYKF